MILQRLAEHYDRLTALSKSSGSGGNTPPPSGYLRQKVSFCVVLNPDGSLNQFESLQRQEGKALLSTLMDIPGQAKPSGSGKNPNFLWDNAAYMLGFRTKDLKPERTKQEFAAFRDWHLSLQGTLKNPAFDAVCTFLASWTEADRTKHREDLAVMATNFGVFKIEGEREYLHNLFPPVAQTQEKKSGKKTRPGVITGVCLVTGNEGVIARLHKPPIKGVSNAQSSGAPFVSLNWPAAWSHGKENSYNAPVSEEVAAKYAKALNLLLDTRDRRVQLGDSTVVFWADHPTLLQDAFSELFSEPFSDDRAIVEEDRERVRQARLYLIQMAPSKKKWPTTGSPLNFSCLGFRPTLRVSLFASGLRQMWRSWSSD
jgi:CRISPR-associated protein Csd1